MFACCLFECNCNLMDFGRFGRKILHYQSGVASFLIDSFPCYHYPLHQVFLGLLKLDLGQAPIPFCWKKILKSKCVTSNAERWWQMSLSPNCCARSADSWRAGPCLLSGHCSTLALAWPPNFIVVISCGTNCGSGCIQCPVSVLCPRDPAVWMLPITSCGVSSGKGTEQERRETFVCDLSETERTGARGEYFCR